MVPAPESPRPNTAAGQRRGGAGEGGAGVSVGGRRPARGAFKASSRAGRQQLRAALAPARRRDQSRGLGRRTGVRIVRRDPGG